MGIPSCIAGICIFCVLLQLCNVVAVQANDRTSAAAQAPQPNGNSKTRPSQPAQRSVPWDPSLALGSPDLPIDDPRIKRLSSGCEEAEQVHLTFWSGTAVLVSWATCDAQLNATSPVSTDGVRSMVYYGTDPSKLTSTAEGRATSYALDFSKLGYGTSYASPVLHHVLLRGLTPGQTYYYKMASGTSDKAANGKDSAPQPAAAAKTYDFKVPKPYNFPMRLGVLGDPGQTYNTTTTLERLIGSKPDVVLLTGDFCYADNFLTFDTMAQKSQYGTITYEAKWDTWSRLFEPLLSRVPLMHTDGNHEIAPYTGDRNKGYNYRFPTPYFSDFDVTKGPTRFQPVNLQGDRFANLYYAVELPGVYKLISLTSYAPDQTFSPDEAQYKWLKEELAKTDRSKTPWLLVAIHAPWYHNYQGHFKEAECVRQAYEQLLVDAKVDVVFHGHVHAYERSTSVNNYKEACDAPMYVTIGDAGNVEGIYKDFVDAPPNGKQAPFCSDPTGNTARLFPRLYQPQACYSYQDGSFCPTSQPGWSAHRDPSFGFGSLDILSPTRAHWRWHRNQAPAWEVADEVVITRGSERRCDAKKGGDSGSSTAPKKGGDSSSSSSAKKGGDGSSSPKKGEGSSNSGGSNGRASSA